MKQLGGFFRQGAPADVQTVEIVVQVKAVPQLGELGGEFVDGVGNLGGDLRRSGAHTGGDDKDGEQRYLDCLDLAIRTSLKYGGNVSHHHGVGTAKAEYLKEEHGEAGVYVMKALKDSLDPDGIINKGVLGL